MLRSLIGDEGQLYKSIFLTRKPRPLVGELHYKIFIVCLIEDGWRGNGDIEGDGYDRKSFTPEAWCGWLFVFCAQRSSLWLKS